MTWRRLKIARPALTRVWRELATLVRGADAVHASHPLESLLLVIGLPDGMRTAALYRSQLLVGRAAWADVRIEAPGISREHVILRLPEPPIRTVDGSDEDTSRYAPELTIQDVGSTNGTIVEGRTLPAWHRQPFRVGQTTQIGCARLMLVGIDCAACIERQAILSLRRLARMRGAG